MPRYLMDFCENYEDKEKCFPEVANARRIRFLRPIEDISLWPVAADQDKLDVLCERCEHAQFVIRDTECPVCQSHILTHVGTGKYGLADPSIAVYVYKCEGCGRALSSHRELK
jgi:hypothetical protein